MANGDRFVGNVIDGNANGYGEFFQTNGSIFKGQWLDE